MGVGSGDGELGLEKDKEYSCEELNNSNACDWNKLNEENVQGTFLQTLKYKEVMERFSCKTHYFLVYRDDEVAALCPFYQSKIVARGLFPITALNTVENIILRYPDDASVARQIVLKCKEIMMTEGLSVTVISLLEDVKNPFKSMDLFLLPWSGAAAGNMTLDLRMHSPQEIWNSLSKKDRRRCRLPERDGWVVNEATSLEELSSFYTYYKANMDYVHGNWVKSLSHFEYLMQTFRAPSSPEMRMLLLRKNKTVAGGFLIFLFDAKKTMYLAYASLNRKVPNRYSPVYTLIWHAIRKASEMGYTTVAFGGAPANANDIHYRIKEKFGCSFERKYNVPFFKSRTLNSALRSLTYISRLFS
jgi:lipid II:glycine glycyltransferase (peptidoglycan interpeptide bridge formation enzyme)